MIIFLCGPDDYRREEKRKSIIAEFQAKAGVSVEAFDLGDKEHFFRFQNFAKNQSLFAPEKFAVLVNIFEPEIKGLAEELKRAAKQSGLTVLFSEKKSTEEFGFLSKKSAKIDVQRFDYLKGAEWEKFVAYQAEKQGIKLNISALKFLARMYENDTWRLVTEMQKISSLAAAGGNAPQPLGGAKHQTALGAAELGKLGLEIAPDFFGLLQGVKNYELGNRMFSLEKLFSMNEPLPKIFNMLIYQWPEKLGRLAIYDILVKSGKLDYEEALVDLVVS